MNTMTFDQEITSDQDMTFDEEMMTPKVSRNKYSFHDDDSGLGFDDEDYEAVFGGEFSPGNDKPEITDSNENEFQIHRLSKGSVVRRDLFSRKRPLQEHECDDYPAPNCRTLRQESVSFAIGDHDDHIMCDSADVKTAMDLMTETGDLVADGSRPYCLPTIPGKHQDLKSISPETGAENLHTHDTVRELLRTGSRDHERHVIIFHCEFSSERGPKMYRFLRAEDRAVNKESYPSLIYPEVYLLDGGYKAFYEHDKTCCSPMSYVPMLHKGHMGDLRHFRSRSKSWAAGQKRKNAMRLQF
ncbi:M-phase inducer phosphatase 1-B-like isoform X2 [Mizuhopecten yessoensis]|uniref:M-phase inducer phosphatase 1-B-like isoform X2 n=1 Tax=Mizuhopecten yessoensis TaxID=6573 RepID=UPI000B4576D5|nr:M-phase inducer phosphatase 1-B-like isoform X2 [Mizuhopecten yessoensis]